MIRKLEFHVKLRAPFYGNPAKQKVVGISTKRKNAHFTVKFHGKRKKQKQKQKK